MNRSWSMPLMVVGVLLIIGGIVLNTVIVPGMKVWPEDVDTTRVYDVEYLTLLQTDPEMAFLTIPAEEADDLQIDRRVVVEEVEGQNMLVREEQTLRNGEQVIVHNVKYHPLDRHSLEFLEDFPDEWAEHEGYWLREGLVIGWGLDVEQRDYTAWNDDTRATVTLEFEGEEEHGGINTYHFVASAPPERIADEHVAALGLPTGLEMPQLQGLAGAIQVDDPEVQARMAGLPLMVMASAKEVLGNDITAAPLEYYYSWEGEYWVEPETGVLIDTIKHEKRFVILPQEVMEVLVEKVKATSDDPDAVDDRLMTMDSYIERAGEGTGDALLPMVVNEFKYQTEPGSMQKAVDDAEEAKARLSLFGKTVPIVLVVLGILLLLLGGYLFTRRPTLA